MPGILAGRTALVTGGSRGIGAAIALRLARDGASVALTYATSPRAADKVVADITADGGRALAIRADNAEPDEVRAAVEATVHTFGGLDILVNNAGGGQFTPIDEMSLDDFDRLFAVNVRGVFTAIREAAGHLPDGGRIITIGSVFADRHPFPGAGGYVAAKAAAAGLTRGAARDLAPRGITVNIVQPGAIDTDANPADGDLSATMLAATPLHRYGTGAEIAGLVAYLASPEAGFVTGATLTADGGFTV
ncbi:3-oxoacyl-ACP reductase family protein [Amycolatopsis sp. NPDC059021]|uniref:3-oxoacyl-ACP reductase family protein n=1 Tax=Amycolatopsis sp. NPDC059021 TaxID=3346704 RepID=UPI00366B8D8A